MGCVYSYPLFSFQGSICFSAAKIILSNLHFLVKYYFPYLIRFCLLFFSTANDILSSIIRFVKHFFIYFSVLVFAVYVSGYQYIIRSPACQCFSFQTFAVDQCLYSFSDCFRAATFIYYTRLTQNVNTFFHLFSPFFDIFSFPSKKGKGSPFSLGIKAAFFIIKPFLVTLICLVCFIGFICLFVFAGINTVFLCKFCSVHALLVVLFRFVCFVIVFVHDYDLLSSFFFLGEHLSQS